MNSAITSLGGVQTACRVEVERRHGAGYVQREGYVHAFAAQNLPRLGGLRTRRAYDQQRERYPAERVHVGTRREFPAAPVSARRANVAEAHGRLPAPAARPYRH